ncbi:4'-phosphopantetheinyl transferase family protein [Sanguibacter suarezii]|uniref:4'-phosphopantetheinyl transferase family protein n=1 Tax=Sanguibacter suarezii TaxID=60921 RepID=UPI000A0003E2|nr:4'-phosphopantetheinyl transferase superfamily protein [Sanguibacter suarezii]
MNLQVPGPVSELVVARLSLPDARVRTGERSGAAADAVILRVPPLPHRTDLPGVLDEGEHARMAQLRRGDDRDRYLLAHTALRLVLGHRLGVRADVLRFARAPCPGCGGPHGRPVLAGASGPEFSLAHGGGLVAVALGDLPVGVDVEPNPSAAVVRRVADHLHPREREMVLSAPEGVRAEVFARLWSRKEAYLKGTGIGLGRGTDTTDATADPPGWAIADLAIAGHAAALASERRRGNR